MKRLSFVFFLVLVFLSPLFSQNLWEKNIRLIDTPIQNNIPCGEVIGDFIVGVDYLGVNVWSLEDPVNPSPVTRLILPGTHPNWIRVNDYLYVEGKMNPNQLAEKRFLFTVNIENPAEPTVTEMQQLNDGRFDGITLKDCFQHGDYIYVTQYNPVRLGRIELQDPAHPVIDDWVCEYTFYQYSKFGNMVVGRTRVGMDFRDCLLLLGVNGPEEVVVIDIEDGDLMLTGDNLICRNDEVIIVYNVENPENVREVSTIEGDFQIHPFDNWFLQYDNSRQIYGAIQFDNYLFLPAAEDMVILSMEDPENPSIVATISHENATKHQSLFAHDNRLYAYVDYKTTADDTSYMNIYDISDPENVELLEEICFRNIYIKYSYSPASGKVHINNDIVSFANHYGIFSIFQMRENNSDILSKIHWGRRLENGVLEYNRIFSWMNGATAFFDLLNRVRIFNLENPAEPELIYAPNQTQSITYVDQNNMFIGLSDGESSTERYDIQDPANLQLTGRCSPGFSIALTTENNKIFRNYSEHRFDALSWDEEVPVHNFSYNNQLKNIDVLDSLIVGYNYDGLTFLYPDFEQNRFEEIAQYRVPENFGQNLVVDNDFGISVNQNGLIAIPSPYMLYLYDAKCPRNTHIVGEIMLPLSGNVQWSDDILYYNGKRAIFRLQPEFTNGHILVTPDTLDFGEVAIHSVHYSTITISPTNESGLTQILGWRFDGDTDGFLGDFGLGWISGSYDDIEISVRFRPMERQRYIARLRYETEEGIVQTIITGACDGWNGVDENPNPVQFSLSNPYPNPFNSSFTVEYQAPSTADLMIQMYDLNGRILWEKSFRPKDTGKHELNLNMEDFSAGEYIMKCSTKDNLVFKKLVLIK